MRTHAVEGVVPFKNGSINYDQKREMLKLEGNKQERKVLIIIWKMEAQTQLLLETAYGLTGSVIFN
jgi:hypothetical protein